MADSTAFNDIRFKLNQLKEGLDKKNSQDERNSLIQTTFQSMLKFLDKNEHDSVKGEIICRFFLMISEEEFFGFVSAREDDDLQDRMTRYMSATINNIVSGVRRFADLNNQANIKRLDNALVRMPTTSELSTLLEKFDSERNTENDAKKEEMIKRILKKMDWIFKKKRKEIIDKEVSKYRSFHWSEGSLHEAHTFSVDISSLFLKAVEDPEIREHIHHDPELCEKIGRFFLARQETEKALELGFNSVLLSQVNYADRHKKLELYQQYLQRSKESKSKNREEINEVIKGLEIISVSGSEYSPVGYQALLELKKIYFSEPYLHNQSYEEKRVKIIKKFSALAELFEKSKSPLEKVYSHQAIVELADILCHSEYGQIVDKAIQEEKSSPKKSKTTLLEVNGIDILAREKNRRFLMKKIKKQLTEGLTYLNKIHESYPKTQHEHVDKVKKDQINVLIQLAKLSLSISPEELGLTKKEKDAAYSSIMNHADVRRQIFENDEHALLGDTAVKEHKFNVAAEHYIKFSEKKDIPIDFRLSKFEALKKLKYWNKNIQNAVNQLQKEYAESQLDKLKGEPGGLLKIIAMTYNVNMDEKKVQAAVNVWCDTYGKSSVFSQWDPAYQEQFIHGILEHSYRGHNAAAIQARDRIISMWSKSASPMNLMLWNIAQHRLYQAEYKYFTQEKNVRELNKLNQHRFPLIMKILTTLPDLKESERQRLRQHAFDPDQFTKEWLTVFRKLAENDQSSYSTEAKAYLASEDARREIKKATASYFRKDLSKLKKLAAQDNLLALDFLRQQLGHKNSDAVLYAAQIVVLTSNMAEISKKSGLSENEIIKIRAAAQESLAKQNRAHLTIHAEHLSEWLDQHDAVAASLPTKAAIEGMRKIMTQEEVRFITATHKSKLKAYIFQDNLLALHKLAHFEPNKASTICLYIKIAILTSDIEGAAKRFGLQVDEVVKMRKEAMHHLSNPKHNIPDKFKRLASWGLELAKSNALKGYVNIKNEGSGRMISTDQIINFALHHQRGRTLAGVKVDNVLNTYKDSYLEGLSSLYPLDELEEDIDNHLEKEFGSWNVLVTHYEDQIEEKRDRTAMLLCSDEEWRQRMKFQDEMKNPAIIKMTEASKEKLYRGMVEKYSAQNRTASEVQKQTLKRGSQSSLFVQPKNEAVKEEKKSAHRSKRKPQLL